MSGIGHNKPPAIEAYSMALDDAYETAKDFLDGQAIENQGQADSIGKIVSEVKKLRKDADAERKAQKEPFLEGGRAIDASFKPLFERADTIARAAQKPLTAWLNKIEAEQKEAARILREKADRKAQEAIEAQRKADGDIEALEAVNALQEDADAAAKEAKRAAKVKPQVSGMDRNIGLRTYKNVTVTDHRAALKWLFERDKAAVEQFINDYAEKHARTCPMDGVAVNEERRVA